METCREMTVRDYIERLGDVDPDLDRKSLQNVLAMYDEENKELHDHYYEVIKAMERKIKEQEMIISCLARCVEVR